MNQQVDRGTPPAEQTDEQMLNERPQTRDSSCNVTSVGMGEPSLLLRQSSCQCTPRGLRASDRLRWWRAHTQMPSDSSLLGCSCPLPPPVPSTYCSCIQTHREMRRLEGRSGRDVALGLWVIWGTPPATGR